MYTKKIINNINDFPGEMIKKIEQKNIMQKNASQKCNLCQKNYFPTKTHDKFCQQCRDYNEIYRYSEWGIYS